MFVTFFEWKGNLTDSTVWPTGKTGDIFFKPFLENTNMSHSEGLLYFWVVLVLITLIYFSGIYPQLKRSSLSNIPIYENIDGYPVLLQHQGKKELSTSSLIFPYYQGDPIFLIKYFSLF